MLLRAWVHGATAKGQARRFSKKASLAKDNRGAVYVEFLVAFLPLFIFFECLLQLAGLYSAKLIVQHAASSAVRAAVVVLHDDPAHYGNVPTGVATGKRRDDIKMAAAIPLRAVKSVVDLDVTFPTSPGGNDDRSDFGRDDLVRVKVTAWYRCQVPIASRLVCGFVDSKREITGEAAMPNQGADYEY